MPVSFPLIRPLPIAVGGDRLQKRDRMHLDAEAGADVVHLLVGLSLHGNASLADVHHGRETLADHLDAGSDFRTLADHGRVDVADRVARRGEFGDDGFENAQGDKKFNDELDEAADAEEEDEE